MDKIQKRNRRRKSIRKKIFGTPETPRMCISKSNRNLSIQIIDDVAGKTLCGLSTQSAEIKGKAGAYTRKNTTFAGTLGGNIAKIAGGKGIKKVVFDRAGHRYHGVVKTVADAARKGGLEF